jgi:hypothetical protein
MPPVLAQTDSKSIEIPFLAQAHAADGGAQGVLKLAIATLARARQTPVTPLKSLALPVIADARPVGE